MRWWQWWHGNECSGSVQRQRWTGAVVGSVRWSAASVLVQREYAVTTVRACSMASTGRRIVGWHPRALALEHPARIRGSGHVCL